MSARPEDHSSITSSGTHGSAPKAQFVEKDRAPPQPGAATASRAPERGQRTAQPGRARVVRKKAAAPHSADPPSGPAAHRWKRHADLAAGAGLALVAAMATALPPGGVRAAVTLPILLVVPGYLLLQALRPDSARRWGHVVAALGLSLPILGLAALLTSIFPGGFTGGAIIVSVTVACLALAGAAAWRRRSLHVRAPATAAATSP